MSRGTKSLICGVHQVFWHPLTVWLAWAWLYRSLPTWRECLCILIHDWGYWGCHQMDDEIGEHHPELGARIAGRLLGQEYHDLVLLHSRHLARHLGREPSRLCWPDKLSIACEPWWFYLPRAWASGELAEYRQRGASSGLLPLSATHREWHRWIRGRLMEIGRARRADVVPYANQRCVSNCGENCGEPSDAERTSPLVEAK